MSRFTHLHVHTHYSLLDGLPKIPQLLDTAREMGMDAVAITDHGVLYGALEFYKEAKARDMKPIIGCEIYVARRSRFDKDVKEDKKSYHLVLLAKNEQGYKNLVKLVSRAHLEGYYYKPRVDKELLKKHSEGLIALSACFAGEVARAVDEDMTLAKARGVVAEYKDIFGEDFYLEIQHHPGIVGRGPARPDEHARHEEVMAKIIELGRETGTPLVATNDIHYINEDDAEAQDAMLCIQTGRYLNDADRLTMMDDDYSMRSPELMAEQFRHVPEAIENTQKIVDKIDLNIEMGKLYMPKFDVPEGETIESYFARLCYTGALRRYNGVEKDVANAEEARSAGLGEEVVKRLEYEIGVIDQMGFPGYFLVVQDFVKFAKDNGISCSPRGSAAGSIVTYVLSIADVDPLKFKLIFERFLNPERVSMPDIDMDIADSRRGEVIEYVTKKYGADHVAQIITFGTMASKNAVRDVGRVMAIPYGEVDQISKLIPLGFTLEQALTQIDELKELVESDPRFGKLIGLAKKLEGSNRHASVHAAGVVISQVPLEDCAPLQRIGTDEDAVVTQYSMNYLESIGLVKMDFLGLANLTVIQDALTIIEKVRGVKIDILKIPEDDAKAFHLLAEAETTGVFQLESEGMKKHLRELKPTTIEDIISMVALYRPGPMESIKDFVDAKHGRREITYLDPKLKPILCDSYGVIVTQDQVLEIARSFAGFSYGQADILRKAVSKKNKKMIDEQHVKFVDGAVSCGSARDLAEQVWAFIEPFARYGFNRAHAACYAVIAYQTAYLKAHYPAEFMAALLTSDRQNIDRIAIEIAECQRMGIEVLPPDVNESFANFTVLGEKKIRFGLSAIKNVGESAVEAVIETRKDKPFESLADFVTRVPANFVNKKVVESLAKAGAMDSICERNTVVLNLERILEYAQKQHKNAASGQIDIFGSMDVSEQPQVASLVLDKVAPATPKEKLAWERELLGIFLGEHPLQALREKIEGKFDEIDSLAARAPEEKVKLLGTITTVKKINTKSGDTMAFVGFEDLSGATELVVFPTIYKENTAVLVQDKIVCVEGRVSFKDNAPKILLNSVREVDDSFMAHVDKIKVKEKKEPVVSVVQVPGINVVIPASADRKILNELKYVFLDVVGGLTKVVVEVGGQKIELPFRIHYNEGVKNKVVGLIGVEPKVQTC